jgi:DNA helicase-2/ATP-dependent DNA helicase PcrA
LLEYLPLYLTNLSELLNALNPQQQAAVTHINGPLLVLAGAGTGKTKTLTHRVAYLIEQGVQPWQILAVTFTNKAAAEMQERIDALLNEGMKELKNEEPNSSIHSFVHSSSANIQTTSKPLISTFHSLGARLLRQHYEELGFTSSPTILDSDDSLAMVKNILKSMEVDPKQYPPRLFWSMISKAQNAQQTPEQLTHNNSNEFFELLPQVFERYLRRKQQNQVVDFDDLITLPVKLFANHDEVRKKYQNRWKYLLIDEFQDTNTVQYELVQLLGGEHQNVCAVGDGDQSIYRFRGAEISNILNFPKQWENCKTVALEQNYRSTKHILDAANGVIQNNQGRLPKDMFTEHAEGEPLQIIPCRDDYEEARLAIEEARKLHYDGYAYQDMAILVRTNRQTRLLEEAALKAGIPYQLVGGLKFYSRKEVKDVLAYLRFIVNPDDEVSLLRIINLPPRKIGQTTINKLLNHARLHSIPLGKVLTHIEMVEGLSAAPIKIIQQWQEKIQRLRDALPHTPPSKMVAAVIEQFGLEQHYLSEGVTGEARVENIQELENVASKMDDGDPAETLPQLLEEIALIADIDTKQEGQDAITMMTVHSAKGLEFPVVILPGIEEGIFPHSRSTDEQAELEEERRLMYVAMTRAEQRLIILHAQTRLWGGQPQGCVPSRFLQEIPHENIAGGMQYNSFGGNDAVDDDFAYSSDEEEVFEVEVNDQVRHASFGVGRVLEVHGNIASINFPGKGTKKMLLTIAPLEKL